jgi:hypothetical protein
MFGQTFTALSINHGCAIFKKKKIPVDNFLPGESGKLRLVMVYRHISKDLKERVLWLISHGYAPELFW